MIRARFEAKIPIIATGNDSYLEEKWEFLKYFLAWILKNHFYKTLRMSLKFSYSLFSKQQDQVSKNITDFISEQIFIRQKT